MGYKASKPGEGNGFVIAGHTAQNLNSIIVQPDHDNSGQVGITRAYQWNSNCDCAYVKADADITVDYQIYKASNTVYTVTGKTIDSSQTLNSWAYKSGAGSGVTLGQIKGNVAGNSYNLLLIYNAIGDSGSAIFKITSGDNVSLYGMLYESSGVIPGVTNIKYHPWEQIQSQIGASPP